MNASQEGARCDVALIVGVGRSGTTLLRLLLDAHPEIGCPAETRLPALAEQLTVLWRTIFGQPPDAAEPLPAKGREQVARAIVAPMEYYCQKEGKRLFCEKSLDSVHHLRAFQGLFPTARYLMLYRHVLDTVASGLEASPWGFNAFGYAAFIHASPDNFVAPLVHHWLAHTDKALSWEAAHPSLCHRIRYEDLVTTPVDTLTKAFRFLDVRVDLSVLEHAFLKAGYGGGPGDYKAPYTERIDARSVGRGRRVPLSMIPAPLLAAANRTLEALDYEPLHEGWTGGAAAARAGAGDSGALADIMRSLGQNGVPSAPASERFAVIADDDEQLRWVVHPGSHVQQGDGDVAYAFVGTAADLVAMIRGSANVGSLLRSRRIRCASADGSADNSTRVIAAALAILRGGTASRAPISRGPSAETS